MDPAQYSKEIEDEVDKCIQGLFKANNPTLSVDEFISILAKFKDSQDKKDKVSLAFVLCLLVPK